MAVVTMTKQYPIVAKNTDDREQFMFHVKFNKVYTVPEGLPITNNAVAMGVEDTYDQLPAWHQQRQLSEGERVATLITTENGEYLRTEPYTK